MNMSVKLAVSVMCAALMSGCASVSLPKIDFLKSPEFKEDAENIGDYPEVADAPVAPRDVRSAKAWDASARKLMTARDRFNVPEGSGTDKTDAELESDIQALKAKVKAYKLDDPQ